MSQACNISNGVKQGGATLFCTYLDKFLGILQKSNAGCCFGYHYMGAFCCADDLTHHQTSLF